MEWNSLCRVTRKFPKCVRGTLFRCAEVKEGHSQLTRTWGVHTYKVPLDKVLHDATQAFQDGFTHKDTLNNTCTHTMCTQVRMSVYTYTCTHDHTRAVIHMEGPSCGLQVRPHCAPHAPLLSPTCPSLQATTDTAFRATLLPGASSLSCSSLDHICKDPIFNQGHIWRLPMDGDFVRIVSEPFHACCSWGGE